MINIDSLKSNVHTYRWSTTMKITDEEDMTEYTVIKGRSYCTNIRFLVWLENEPEGEQFVKFEISGFGNNAEFHFLVKDNETEVFNFINMAISTFA